MKELFKSQSEANQPNGYIRTFPMKHCGSDRCLDQWGAGTPFKCTYLTACLPRVTFNHFSYWLNCNIYSLITSRPVVTCSPIFPVSRFSKLTAIAIDSPLFERNIASFGSLSTMHTSTLPPAFPQRTHARCVGPMSTTSTSILPQTHVPPSCLRQ